MLAGLCTIWRGLAETKEDVSAGDVQRTKLKAASRTFCVAWADSGRGGTPLRGARPHCYNIAGTQWNGAVSDTCADIGAEDQTSVSAVNADFVGRDLPPGSGRVLPLQRRVTCGKHRRDT